MILLKDTKQQIRSSKEVIKVFQDLLLTEEKAFSFKEDKEV